MISFKNDYSEGAHPKIIEALVKTNCEQTDGYGEDNYTLEAYKNIKNKLKCDNCYIRFLVGGTQSNLTVISHILRPYQAVISAETGHINSHETGSIEATGHKVVLIKTEDGKLNPKLIENLLSFHKDAHNVEPKMVYISNPNELGVLYKKEELSLLYRYCKKNGLYLFIDGARLASALTSEYNDILFEDYKNLCDILYVGGTKCGAYFGEGIIFFNENLSKGFQYSIKQRGALFAKGRLLGIQFNELFKDNLYWEIGRHSNLMAQKLKDNFIKNGIRLYKDSYSNQLFVIISNDILKELEKGYKYEIQEKNEKESVVRLVTSWATKEENINLFIKDFNKIYNK
ncbi:threonine aldolase family protein [Fusobacterium sp. MFO224]|uniref:threonine aldolase family protein n=1 Tax=Fusobacterium sp. MFO224 TaxID=3378070 RepID=UPI003854BFE3